jgi:hypothetical protein
MTELRSSPQGHPNYRRVAQLMAKAVAEKMPLVGKHCLNFVDYKDYELERLEAFRKLEERAKRSGVEVFKEEQSEQDLKLALGNTVVAAVRKMNELGFEAEECIKLAAALQEKLRG